jgi:hypothetical protein
MGISQFEENPALVGVLLINAATGTAPVGTTAFQGRQHRCDFLYVSNTDVIGHVVRVLMNKGGVRTILGSELVPAGQGIAGTPSIDLLVAALPTGEEGIVLDPTCELDVSVEVAVTLSNTVEVTFQGGYV